MKLENKDIAIQITENLRNEDYPEMFNLLFTNEKNYDLTDYRVTGTLRELGQTGDGYLDQRYMSYSISITDITEEVSYEDESSENNSFGVERIKIIEYIVNTLLA